jgi:site-specific DNA-methyltransferase (adenine-specific)
MSLAPQLWRVLKPGGHFYIFYAQSQRHMIVNCLASAGLSVIEPDLIWNKGRNMNAFGGYNFMSYYEPILFGYKPGDNDFMRRLAEPMGNIITCPPLDEKIHSFEKPHDLLEKLIKQSTNPGDIILDPFAGSFSTGRSARKLGRSGIGFELSEKNFIAAQAALAAERSELK